ncbi:MAG: chromosome segregation protein [Alteromonadaceae bacterium]|jgi:chromosome segregation protein
MRLKHIKLAGFKSFVDPTKIPFEQQMTAIVGPNGCGKSNVIDAVRWVLGESSAKNLRGNAMTDVIFNGAASRKSVGQASVELVFNNIDGRIQGSMADRNEISIRRVVNRESINTYYLNGTKCRRRDITDIFLGTGLGPRSYAIIEQGTISRLIESKPQDLRVFIEEAAGISKYKERRRDTETRIRHTRENLERLSDIRIELGLQLDKLHQQAEAAKRFKTLKKQERTYKAELSLLRWQEFNGKKEQSLLACNNAQVSIEQLAAEQKQENISLFQAKQLLELGSENIDDLQKKKLQLTNDIARTEQNVKYLKNSIVKAEQDNSITQRQLINAQQGLLTEQGKLAELDVRLVEKTPILLAAEQQLTTQQSHLEKINERQLNHQSLVKNHHHSVTEYNKNVAQIDNDISAYKAMLIRTDTRQNEIKQALTAIKRDDLPALKLAEQLVIKEKDSLSAFINAANKLGEIVEQNQAQINSKNQQLAKAQGGLVALGKQYEQLQVQQNQQADWSEKQQQWLAQHGYQDQGTLFSNVSVDKGWEKAIELVLSHWLQAQVLTEFPDDITLDTALFALSKNNDEAIMPGSIAEKISGTITNLPFINQIFFADNLAAAQQLLPRLNRFQSVLCKDATWLGHGFLQKGIVEHHGGYLQRADSINDVKSHIEEVNAEITASESTLTMLTEQLVKQQLEQKGVNEKVNLAQQSLQQHQQAYASKEQHQQHIEGQRQSLQTELIALAKQLTDEQTRLLKSQQDRASHLSPDSQQSIILEQEHQEIQQQIQHIQVQLKQLNEERHQLAVVIEQLKNDRVQSTQSLMRSQETIERLTEQQANNQQMVEDSSLPLQSDEIKLQQWLKDMSVVDEKIQAVQLNMANAQQKVKQFEQKQQTITHAIDGFKDKLAQHHLDAESYRLRAESAAEILNEMQKNITDVEKNMPKNAKQALWQANIVRLAKDINRLGPINLAAIDEFESQFERKSYLDHQNDDLILAITTLESAIEKIDSESRDKFKATFEQVNIDLKTLFPKVFGGGSAYLELTGEDMLDTGVTIMARPPGKKNSTIHLLSGGEKALTALSLVFAIFRLNPAPFCMLDEVDAPLDDANVSRFCNLVREMSQTVQFIYISHNKIAMEMASHLTGVTMFEAGVSKMVAVDIDEAVAMAEIS